MSSTLKPAISIIVPVYKAEKYLHRCVDSILGQTFKDFELILVDDGSPDKSGEICDEYAGKDNRVIVIHKENGGVASARQCGIDRAMGEYTIHADPDDWMELDMLESMYRAIKENDADVLVTDYFVNIEDEETYTKGLVESIMQDEILKGILLNDIHGALWNKLIRTYIYKDNNIGFIEKIDLREDVLFWLRIFQIDGLKIFYLPKAFYHYDYFSNDNSITKRKDNKVSVIIEKYISTLEEILPEKFKYEKEVSITTILSDAFFKNIHIDNYCLKLSKYITCIKDMKYSKINKTFLRLSCKNRRFSYFLYSIKRYIHFRYLALKN